MTTPTYPRDLHGYGANPPHADWPGNARLAVQFVINYEEGGERCILHGDDSSEAFLSEIVGAQSYSGCRHVNMESLYEYGARAGFWRLHRLFREFDMPVTVFGDNPDDTDDLLAMLGEPPHVIKLTEGSQGRGVMLTEKPSASRSVVDALRGLYATFLLQEFVAEAAGADLRCLVVGNEVVAAMRRQAPDGDFRANLHRGGSAEGVQLDAAEADIAIRAARALGLGVAGVDLIASARGPLVLEVNASPGLEGIERSTGVDVAGRIIDFVAAGATGRGMASQKRVRRSAPAKNQRGV